MAKPIFDAATALQTAMLAAQWVETMKEYEDARETRNQWESRNSAEFGVKAGQRGKEAAISAEQLAIDRAASSLDRSDIGLGERKVGLDRERLIDKEKEIELDRDRIDQAFKKTKEEEKMFNIAGAGALTEREAAGAIAAAEEDAAGIAGTGARDMARYLEWLPAHAKSFEDEAKAFTDPLLSGVPGTTVTGSRYNSDFASAQGPAAYARDNRMAEIDAFAAAMNQSRDPLANIGLGQASKDAQMQRISKEMGLAGADQSLAGAGLKEKIRKIGEDDLNIDRKDLDLALSGIGIDRRGLDIDLSSLGLDKSRTGLSDRKASARHRSVTDALASQAALDSIAAAHPKTLRGQQSVTFPGSSLLGTTADLVDAFKPKQTQVTIDRTGPKYGYGNYQSYGGLSYGGGHHGK